MIKQESSLSKSIFQILILTFPFLFGAISFLVVIGPNILDVKNENWLLSGGDEMQHYLGWIFYRQSSWSFPIGLNPNWDIGMNNSVVFSDSIPLLAIAGKFLSPLIPERFQYFGIYLFVSFICQSVFAWKIFRLFTSSQLICLLGTGLILFSQPMLSLLPDNIPVASHFLIIAALYLCLKHSVKHDLISWFVLFVISLLVHPYIFAIVYVLWLSSSCEICFLKKQKGLSNFLKEIVISLSLCLSIGWQAGYLSVGSSSASESGLGYGIFKINLLGFANPNGWSYLLENLYTQPTWWGEQPIYLGLGGLIALCIVIVNGKKTLSLFKQCIGNHPLLTITLILLTIFAISNKIEIGSQAAYIELPKVIEKILGIFRISSRMFWPTFYLFLFFLVYALQKIYTRKICIGILALCFFTQVLDLSAGWIPLRAKTMLTTENKYTETPLKDPFWKWAALNYEKIIIVPSRLNLKPDFMARMLSSDWKIFGRFASSNHMSTNAVYLARYNEQKILIYSQELMASIDSNEFNNNSIYVINKDEVGPIACLLLENKENLFAKVDSYYVVAPNYFKRSDVQAPPPSVDIKMLTSVPKIKESILFSSSNQDLQPYILCKGWSEKEGWGVWSNDKKSKIIFRIPEGAPSTLDLNLRAFVTPSIPTQFIELSVNGGERQKIKLKDFNNNLISIPIPRSSLKDGILSLDLVLKNASSPTSAGISNHDNRLLSIGLVSANFKK